MGLKKTIMLTALTMACASAGWTQSTSVITGTVYADYWYNLNNSAPALKYQDAFNIRRIYFTFENNITADLKFRFRLENEGGGYGTTYTTGKFNPFIKHAYLEWSNLIPNHKLILGIQETNLFKNEEEAWGYRSIEKTVEDLNSISSSADLGIGLKGDITPTVHHWLTVMNGTGYSAPEADRYKRIGYALWLTPVSGLTLEGYVDYEKQGAGDPQTAVQLSSAKGYQLASSYMTMKGFIGYSTATLTLGVDAFTRVNKDAGIKNVTTAIADTAKKTYKVTGSSLADLKRFGYSAFATWITPIPQVKVFARYDLYDPNNDDSVVTAFDTAKNKLTNGMNDETRLIIAGIDYVAAGGIHLMPNVMIKKYASATGKKDDVTARMTLWFNYNSGKIITQ
jgi:hypothetical protein